MYCVYAEKLALVSNWNDFEIYFAANRLWSRQRKTDGRQRRNGLNAASALGGHYATSVSNEAYNESIAAYVY